MSQGNTVFFAVPRHTLPEARAGVHFSAVETGLFEVSYSLLVASGGLKALEAGLPGRQVALQGYFSPEICRNSRFLLRVGRWLLTLCRKGWLVGMR